jgi:hypothetical protein
MNKLVDVVVAQDSLSSKLSQQLLYDYASSAIVTSISPTVLNVLGRLILTS